MENRKKRDFSCYKVVEHKLNLGLEVLQKEKLF